MRAAGAVLLLAHLSIIGWLTLRPRPVPWVPAENLEPLATIRAELAHGTWQAVQELAGPALLLAPLGLLLPMVGGRLDASAIGSFVRTVFAGAMLAFTLQMLKGGVPGRVADVDLALLNTFGVAVTHALIVPAVRARLRRREEPAGRPTPTIARVGLARQADALSGSRTYL